MILYQTITNKKIKSFLNQYNELTTKYRYSDDNILNMDETPTWFNQPIQKTISIKGSKQVHVKTATDGKKRVATILTCKLLPPCIIEASKSKLAKDTPGNTRYVRDGITIYKQETQILLILWQTG